MGVEFLVLHTTNLETVGELKVCLNENLYLIPRQALNSPSNVGDVKNLANSHLIKIFQFWRKKIISRWNIEEYITICILISVDRFSKECIHAKSVFNCNTQIHVNNVQYLLIGGECDRSNSLYAEMVTNEVLYLVRGIMRIIPPAIRRLSILVSHFLPVSWLLHTLIYEERIFGKNHQCLAKIFRGSNTSNCHTWWFK